MCAVFRNSEREVVERRRGLQKEKKERGETEDCGEGIRSAPGTETPFLLSHLPFLWQAQATCHPLIPLSFI